MATKDACECRIRVGEVVLSLNCPSSGYAASLERYFRAADTTGSPCIRLNLKIMPASDLGAVPSSLLADKWVQGNEFCLADGLVRGTYDPERREGELCVSCRLTKGQLTRVFEQIIYQVFYSAAKSCRHQDYLVHSCGVVCDGQGFLFAGRSGSGKTTVARLSRRHRVLNDEVSLIRLRGGMVSLHSTPFNGYFAGKTTGSAPLVAVLHLAHGPAHRLVRISPAEAAMRLVPEIVPPVGLEEQLTQPVRSTMLDVAARVSQSVSARRLEFRPDGGFWSLIQDEFFSQDEVDNDRSTLEVDSHTL